MSTGAEAHLQAESADGLRQLIWIKGRHAGVGRHTGFCGHRREPHPRQSPHLEASLRQRTYLQT